MKKNFGVYAGVELSYLTQQEQEIIDEVICEFNYKLDINKSKTIKGAIEGRAKD